ncbi:MAG: hypothetical protein KDK66_07390, partial [Deltaproteobacteria bacterium]|nr:hypothetical protein [Deltaproteobacteria bacterium]
ASSASIFVVDIHHLDSLGAPQIVTASFNGWIYEMRLSPDKEKLFFISPINPGYTQAGLFMVEVANFPSVGLSQLLSGPINAVGTSVISGYQVSPDSNKVVYGADQDVDNVIELYWVDISNPALPDPALKVHTDLVANPAFSNTFPPGNGSNNLAFNLESSRLYYTYTGDLYRINLDPDPGLSAPQLLSLDVLVDYTNYDPQEEILFFSPFGSEENYAINISSGTQAENPIDLSSYQVQYFNLDFAENTQLLRHKNGLQLLYTENTGNYTFYERAALDYPDLNQNPLGEAEAISQAKVINYPQDSWKEGRSNSPQTAYFFLFNTFKEGEAVISGDFIRDSIYGIDLEGSLEPVKLSPEGEPIYSFQVY